MARFWSGSIILYLCFKLALRTRSESTSHIVWISPVEGSTFHPGDTIIGKWYSNSSLVSPSFSLCEVSSVGGSLKDYNYNYTEEKDEDGVDGDRGRGESGACGLAVWPHVQEQEDGYMTIIFVSNVSEDKRYNLKMQDYYGNVFFSPSFYLKTLPSVTTYSSHIHMSAPASETISSTPPTSTTPAALAESSVVDSGHYTKTPHVIIPTSEALLPDVFVSNRPSQIIAFTVPIIVVSVVALIAALLCIRARRKLVRAQRKNGLKTLLLSRTRSHNSFEKNVPKASSPARYPGGYCPNPDAFPIATFMPRYDIREGTRTLYPHPQSRKLFPKSYDTDPRYEQSCTNPNPNPAAGRFVVTRRTMKTPPSTSIYAASLSKPPPLHVRIESSVVPHIPSRHPAAAVDVHAVIEERLRDRK